MFNQIQNDAYLVLEDGSIFEGKAAGILGTTGGEICFNTGMTGYQEIFTDPSYFGQIMVMSNAHIGNYAIKNNESESENVQISGLVCRNFSEHFSRKIADQTLQEFLEQNKIVAIHNVDTRALVRLIRAKGAMNAVISSEFKDVQKIKEYLKSVPNMQGLELASKVSTDQSYLMGEGKYKVAVLDFGVKKSILKQLEKNNSTLKVFPAKTSFKELELWEPDAYFLSNGPGDPEPMDYAIQTARSIIESRKPCFGICLGHQILSLAFDIPTYKMHHGHRGINHPVLNTVSGKAEITSQNHGFAINTDALQSKKDFIQMTHFNLNDKTVEGIQHKSLPIFSVQYHPEAGPGPHDSRYLFQQFVNTIATINSYN